MGGASIKQIIRGTTTGTKSNVSLGFTVDTTKSIILFSSRDPAASSLSKDANVTAFFASGSTLNVWAGNRTDSPVVEWTVIEFASGVSVQHVSTSMGSVTTNTVTINPVDMSKSVVLYCGGYGGDSTVYALEFDTAVTLLNSTTVQFQRDSSKFGFTAKASILEFI